jgi:hypothetical protein
VTSDTVTTPGPAGEPPTPDGAAASTEVPTPAPKQSRRQRRKNRPVTRGRYIRRRIMVAVLALVAVAAVWFGLSFRPYVTDSNGEPVSVLLAEWGRDNNLGPVVAKAEDFYYAHFATVPVGGKPTEAAIVAQPSLPGSSSSTKPVVVAHAHLMPPPTLVSPVADTVPGEGVWQPVGSLVDGRSAIYVTRVRPDAVHTSVLASMMWIDTKLTRTMLVPGYIEPGGPNPSNGALPKQYWPSVLANFNGGFRLQDSRGGYFFQGTMVAPLVGGRATATIGKDGSINIGAWNRDFAMTPNTSVVLQNLDLIVDGGQSKVQPGTGFTWGATTHGETLAWRSALGIRPDGSLVYIGSPGLSAESMADTLVKAGVVRAMVLDMNNWWVAGFYFNHTAAGAPVCAKLDPNIAEGCDRFLNKYKRDNFQILAAP